MQRVQVVEVCRRDLDTAPCRISHCCPSTARLPELQPPRMSGWQADAPPLTLFQAKALHVSERTEDTDRPGNCHVRGNTCRKDQMGCDISLRSGCSSIIRLAILVSENNRRSS